ncbi:SH3 domain-containing protein [Yoonia litorea]|nr:SH3 domain-containing protein [Yoonia litorea]
MFQLSGGADFEPRERVTYTEAPWAPLEISERNLVRRASVDAPTETTPVAAGFQILPTDYVYVPAIPSAPVAAERETASNVILASVPVEETTTSSNIRMKAVRPAANEALQDLVQVSGNGVNMRTGPSTAYAVIDTLPLGQEAIRLSTEDGWSQIRVIETGEIGWMSSRFIASNG